MESGYQALAISLRGYDINVKFMKALSITTIIIAGLSILSAMGYIWVALIQGQEGVDPAPSLSLGFVQIAIASLLGYAGFYALNNRTQWKVRLGISWAVFVGFVLYVIATA